MFDLYILPWKRTFWNLKIEESGKMFLPFLLWVILRFHLRFRGSIIFDEKSIYGGFLKWWYPTTMGFPTKTDHFGVFWGYHHFKKHPYKTTELSLAADEICSSLSVERRVESRIRFQRVTLHEKLSIWLQAFYWWVTQMDRQSDMAWDTVHFQTISHPPSCGPELLKRNIFSHSLSLFIYQHLIQQHQVPFWRAFFLKDIGEKKSGSSFCPKLLPSEWDPSSLEDVTRSSQNPSTRYHADGAGGGSGDLALVGNEDKDQE